MNGSNRYPEYPDNEFEEELYSEESTQPNDTFSSFDDLSDAPDLSEDPSESESGALFEWDDLFETIPYWSANSRSTFTPRDTKDPDQETLEFEGYGFETPESHDQTLKDHTWEEEPLEPEISAARPLKDPASRLKEKGIRRPERIERLARTIYASGASAGQIHGMSHPTTLPKDAGSSYESADLIEARQLLYLLAQAIKSARTADEASGLASTLIPVAMRLFPQVNRGLWPAMPALASSISRLARELFARPYYRSFTTWLPKVLESTLDSLANRVRAGQSVTSRLTSALFARRATSLLSKWERTYQPDRRRNESNPETGHHGRG